MPELTIPIFVYGTLKPGEQAFEQWCAPHAIDPQPALAQGRLYHLPVGYPAMTLETGWVQGVALRLTSQAALQRLDDFEDFFPDRPLESLYQRLHQTIYTLNRQPLTTAWTYVMARSQVERWGGIWLPMGVWSAADPAVPEPGI